MGWCIRLVIFVWWTATRTQASNQHLGADICRDGGIKDVTNSETINITSFYNTKSRSVNINITTNDLPHSCINVIHKHINENSTNCDAGYFYSYFSENTGETSTILPAGHANTHELLQAGCAYEIFVRDENGNYVQKEFSMPECFEQLCNCRHLHPKLEIVQIEQTGSNELRVKWKELQTNFNPFTRVANKTFWIEQQNSTNKFRCKNSEVNSSAVLNCTRRFSAENYTLNVGFWDDFGCKGKNGRQFEGIDMAPKEEVITNNLSVLKQINGTITEVVAVYNADYNILQLNISWGETKENNVVVSIESENQDTSGRCYVSSHLKMREVARNVNLPHVDENYTLLPGCTYKITLQTPSNKETMQYTISACLENYLSQIETPPILVFDNRFIEVAYQTHFLENLIIERTSLYTSDFSYICDCALFKSKANVAIFNCNYALQTDVSYVLGLSLFGDNEECAIKYLQTLHAMPTKRLSRAAINDDEKLVANTTLEIEAFYNEIHGVIQLNVTLPLANTTEDFIRFHIAALPNDKTNSCDTNYAYETAINVAPVKSTISFMLPTQPASKNDELQGGCAYEIRVKDSEAFVYRVPVCVGPICNFCSNSTPQVDLKSVTQTSAYVLNTTWLLATPEYNISQVEFKYRDNETSHIPHRCKLLASTHGVNIADEIFSSVECRGLIDGTTYVLIATITNHFNCTRVVSKSFTAVWFDNPEESYKHHLWIEIPAFLSILILVSLILFYKRRVLLEKFKLSNTRIEAYEIYETPAAGEMRKAQECYNVIYCESEILSGSVDKYEIPRSRIKIVKLLDSGAFGQVFSARILGTVDNKPFPPVAAKMLRDHAPPEEVEDFLSEIEILKRIGEHPNIVKLIGCCTLKQPYMMVMELVPCGSLKTYLLKLRKRWENYKTNDSVFLDSIDGDYIQPNTPTSQASTLPSHKFPSLTETEYTNLGSEGHTPLLNNFNYNIEPVLDHTELQNFALQIAKGMAYLEEKQITHRDLAARNILINEFKTLKISDFGLSRVGPYINSKTKKLPLRWMSIEAIEDHFYNNKSDVWSFGIVLWEIGSLGAIPYDNTPDALILHDLLIGKRLEKPAICTNDLYELMLKCWAHDPDLRPSFAELVEQLDVKKTRIYVDFSQLNPTYVFPPSTLEKMSNAQVVAER